MIKSSTQGEPDRIEGTGASQLVQLIRKLGHNDYDRFELATVTSAPPNLRIKIDGWPVELEGDDLVVARRLTRHKRKVTITGTSNTNVSTVAPSQTAGGTYPAGDPTNSIDFAEFTIANADITVTEAEIEFLDELAVGDRVIVASANEGQRYYILDWAEVLT